MRFNAIYEKRRWDHSGDISYPRNAGEIKLELDATDRRSARTEAEKRKADYTKETSKTGRTQDAVLLKIIPNAA
jgi:hypothetical protein